MYRWVHVVKDGKIAIRSNLYGEGETMHTVTADTLAHKEEGYEIGFYFEINGKNPSTGKPNPVYLLPRDGDSIYGMEIINGVKQTIFAHHWPPEGYDVDGEPITDDTDTYDDDEDAS